MKTCRKKWASLILVCLMLTMAMSTGCGTEGDSRQKQPDGGPDKIKVICTIFPEYDWVREIIGEASEDYDLTLLCDKGADLHSYQPTADDIARIGDCDVFIYVGGSSDRWVKEVLAGRKNKKTEIVRLMDVIGERVKREEIVEGMEADEDSDERGVEFDEHLWLSIKSVEKIVPAIEKALARVNPDNEKTLENNSKKYIEKLKKLDLQFEKTVAKGKTDTLVFGDRFPFRYFADDYGLKYYAAFPGCSAESEASFKTIVFLAKKIDKLNLNNVIVIENSDKKIAEKIVENTKKNSQNVLVMNSMQSTTEEDMNRGETYLKIMESNLKTLNKALN